MDFASQLQNLEKRAASAASGGNDRRRERSPDPRSGGTGGPSYRNQRPRYDSNHHSSSTSPHSRQNNSYHQSQTQHGRSPLEAMKRYGYNVVPPPEFFSPQKRKRSAVPHICLLAITIDDLPFERIWKTWAMENSADSDGAVDAAPCYVSLVCHAKFPDKVQSAWLRQRLILKPPRRGRGKTYDDPVYLTHSPAWGSKEITRAMRDVLVTATRIGTSNRPDNHTTTAKDKAIEELIPDPRFNPNRFVIGNNAGDSDGDVSSIPPVDTFIFISETCLPVRTLKECRDILFPATAENIADMSETKQPTQTDDAGDSAAMKSVVATTNKGTTTVAKVDPWDISWLNARNRNMEGTPRNLYERDQFGNIHRMVPGICRWKADQWMLLSRKHALAVLHIDHHMPPKDELWNAFANVNASDEMYFPTALAVLGILQEDGGGSASVPPAAGLMDGRPENEDRYANEPDQRPNPLEVEKRPVTYTDWSEGMRNPTSFSSVRDLKRVASAAREQGCLMARKFVIATDAPAISVDDWNNVMQKMAVQEREKKDQ